ncbi:MAG TPA: outer-membrane lipoprotein carrier protein LolA [Fimbriimonas sp.]|nr:outer-membrane lipoprotein carrier protein LolA [Fimbriimonas sp.]
MKHLYVAASVLLLGAGIASQSNQGPLSSHYDAMRKAETLKVEFTATKLSGGSEKGTFLFAKKNKFRIESPSKLMVSNGEKLWVLDKAANTYTESEANLTSAKTGDVWAWQMFWADATGHFDFVSMSPKGTRTMRGAIVNEYELTLKDGSKINVMIDDKTKLARGFTNSEKVVMATTIATPELADPIREFTFTPPSGAKLIEKPALSEVAYATVEPILKASCVGCHNAGNAKGGYATDTYASTMKRVVAGDAANSPLIQYVKGIKQPRMPRGGVLAQKDIEALEAWVNAGAKQ